MRIFVVICIVAACVLFSAASAQQNYDGRNGPHQLGTPGNGIYIRGQNEGPYNVPGVGGTFQNSPSSGRHEYTDEHGNTYYHSPSPSLSGASTTKDLSWAITSFLSVIWVIFMGSH